MSALSFGDVPKRLKGSDSKSDRSGNRRGGSNPSISVMENWLIDNAIYLLAALGTVFAFVWIRSFNELLNISHVTMAGICAAYTALDAVAVKLMAVIESFSLDGIERLSLFGAVLFMPLAVWGAGKLIKAPLGLWFDINTPAFIFMFMLGRVNCLITGCCVGIYLTDTYRWPVREAEILFYFILLFIFCTRLRKGVFTGGLYPAFLISYGIFRFAVEWVRYIPGVTTVIHPGHIWAATALAAGTVSFILVRRKNLQKQKEEFTEKSYT